MEHHSVQYICKTVQVMEWIICCSVLVKKELSILGC
uniref:Uncharacterized protein n=1 Tax=Arundo donax TaxID=35708 RepID=A0A0A9H6E7_ARUDO